MIRLPLFISLFACGNKEQADTSEDTAMVEDTTPTKPGSIVIETSGVENLSLLFDTPTCQIPSAASNFNTFWRNGTGAHVFVLRIMLRGDYEGPGVYNTTDNSLLVSLQEEAGGQGRYYAIDTAQGDSASIELKTDPSDRNLVYGTLTINALHSTDGAISISPTEIPLWCDAENTAGVGQ